jgi:hypothetical protein
MTRKGIEMGRLFRDCWVLLVLPIFFPPSIAALADDGNYTTRGSSWSSTAREWTLTVQYEDIVNYAKRPDEPTLNSLSVEWKEAAIDALGNQLTIRGQVMVTEGDDYQKRTKHVDWFQGVTVYLGMSPDAKPDWSIGMDESNTLDATTVTSPTGTFEARIDMRDSKYDRNQEQSFQFGLALAKHSGNDGRNQTVIWNSKAPAIPSSVQMLTVPAAPELSRELAFINRASGWPFANPNGVDLIRAVNALQPLGKEQALRVLEQYVDLTQDSEYGSDQEIVFWIIRLLFEAALIGDRIPSPGIAVWLDDRELPEAMKWPLNPMTVEGDIPFMVGYRIGMSGPPEHRSAHIRWARLHGVIREEPLVPKVNPPAGAEAILQSRRFKALSEYSRMESTRAIQSQAFAMVQDLGLVQADKHNPVDDAQWRSSLKAAADAGVRWDAKSEQFVTGRNQ